jgi:hypothetical protein
MRCPEEIADIAAEILAVGPLRIRAAGSSGDAAKCAAEADHLHNLPALLHRYRPELLVHYWDVERTAFIRRSNGVSMEPFEGMWHRLRKCLPQRGIPA